MMYPPNFEFFWYNIALHAFFRLHAASHSAPNTTEPVVPMSGICRFWLTRQLFAKRKVEGLRELSMVN